MPAVKGVVNRLVSLYGDAAASKFGPLSLEAIRYRLVQDGLSRKTVNDYVGIIRCIFKWEGGG